MNLKDAFRIIEAGIKSAEKRGLQCSIAVVDETGALLALARMDGAPISSMDSAKEKAWVAWLLREPSSEVLRCGTFIVPIAGGLPIENDKGVIGGVGVSGRTPEDDIVICKAALATFQKPLKKPMRVVLTGSISTGKSTAAKFFEQLGAHIIDWDAMAREMMSPQSIIWRRLLRYFGPSILSEDSTVNSKKLAGIVFNDPEKLDELGRITHDAMFGEAERKVEEIMLSNPDNNIIIDDVAIVHYEGFHRLLSRADKVIVVYASKETQIKRLKEKGFSEEEVMKRMRPQEEQIPLSKKMEFADFVIYNDGSLEELERQVQEVYKELSRLEG
jgi:dephospho-CoA kinase